MDTITAIPARPKIIPRKPELPFSTGGVPRHWFGARRLQTMLANGINLLFPAGERFFVRSVHHYLDQISDPALREQVKGFSAQEGRHARAHEEFFELMRTQGFEIDRFLSLYTQIAYGTIEKILSPELRLAATAAAEHFTALLGENALLAEKRVREETLANKRVFVGIHPIMQDLLLWHAAEEIEHKSVAFDVFQQVDGGYATRMGGLAIATTVLTSAWFIATVMLYVQDLKMGVPPKADNVQSVGELPERKGPLRTILRGIVSYIHPSFHPDKNDNYALARDYLSRKGMALS